MTSRTLYAVATSASAAQRMLLHLGSNDRVMGDKDIAETAAARMSELFDDTYKVFAGQVTVVMLED
jgi:hypothetical protein